MEKLIELVVKCQKELKQGYSLWDTEGAIKNSKEILISKSFGFIGRLVKNDKINIDKIENSEYYLIDWFYYNERKKFGIEWLDDVEKILLMFLAISENPIEDLISYLK